MRLVDLEPEWLTPDLFIFKNPMGGDNWLTCKRISILRREQYDLIYYKSKKYVGKVVVLSNPDVAWSFEGNDFNTLTVTPSIDASSSGNWHGFITNGEIK